MKPVRVAVLGSGIFGLAHAWAATKRGHQVTVFERDDSARGASVRNFGMIWPIGQTAGDVYRLAVRSRSLWLTLCKQAGLWIRECGSIHLAHREDELAVIEEFDSRSSDLGVECRLVTRAEIQKLTPAAQTTGLLGGMYSPTECCVDPRQVIRLLPKWLSEQLGVEFCFQTPIMRVVSDGGQVDLVTSSGQHQSFDLVVVCGGADTTLLFPDAIDRQSRTCKLQMLKTAPQAVNWHVGPHLAGGLTLRHYRNFECCPSLSLLKQRIADETPELDQYGVHVMISQNQQGEIIMGDSHEYGDNITPFDKSFIDDLILRELKKIVKLPDWSIAERWHGIYVKHSQRPVVESSPLPNVHVFAATGGTGMTLSQGIAESFWGMMSKSS